MSENPAPAADLVRRKRKKQCPKCKGFGLTGRRDQWGFGIACPSCEGTGKVLVEVLTRHPEDGA